MTSFECSLRKSLSYAVFQSHDRRREIVRLNDEIAKYKEQVKQQKEELTQLHWDTKDMTKNDRVIQVLFVLIGLGIVVNFIRVFTAQLLGG